VVERYLDQGSGAKREMLHELFKSAAVTGRASRSMLFWGPKFPMLNAPNSARYARIMPDYTQFCRPVSNTRRQNATRCHKSSTCI
jgi:hypothetical protein